MFVALTERNKIQIKHVVVTTRIIRLTDGDDEFQFKLVYVDTSLLVLYPQ